MVGLLGIVAPKIYYHYQEVPIQAFTPQVHNKTVIAKKVVKHKNIKYSHPEGKVLEIAELVSRETGYSVEIISKIMFAESNYDINARHVNKNKSVDSGLFQINSQHIPLAKKMGIDIMTPEGNAKFAIYLIQKNGLRDWGYSKSKWSVI